MADRELLKILATGVESWNQWRQNTLDKVLDLRDADLSEWNLTGVYLYSAHLQGAHLKDTNLTGAHLQGADLTDADLFGAHLQGADLRGAHLMDAELRGANLTGADLRHTELTGADLRSADLTDVVIFDADLRRANLTDADLTRARFIRCNLRDAVVENACVTYIDIQQLRGVPKPPKKLRLDSGRKMVVLRGERAKSFFLRLEEVKVVLDRALPDKLLAAYHLFIGESKAKNEWPRDVAFIGAYVNHGQTILSYQALNVEDVVVNLPLLLQPFPSIDAVDWSKTLKTYLKKRAEPLVRALAVKKEFRSLIADKLRKYKEFASTKPVTVRTKTQTIRFEMDPAITAKIQPGAIFAPQLMLVEGDQHMTEQHFHSGQFQGCNFGDNNSLTNYFGVVDNLGTVEEDVKQKLKEARGAIERADLSDADKADVVDELNKLTTELEKPEKNEGRVKRYWNHIKEVAPTVASILASAASLAKLLGGG